MNKDVLNWNSIELYAIDVGLQIKSERPYLNEDSHCIVAVSRGGLIPARLIARELNTKEIFCIGASSYTFDNKRLETHRVYQPLDEDTVRRINSYQDVIFVDDIVDSGNTFSFLRRYWDETLCKYNETTEYRRANIYTASLVYKPANKDVSPPDFFGSLREDSERWLVFPWESTN